jgi:hypothetical protein
VSNLTTVAVGGGPSAVEADLCVPSLAHIRDATEDAETELVWLLGEGAEPCPGALEALLEAGDEPAASLAVDVAGAPLEAALGRFAEESAAGLLQSASEKRVPLRHTFVSSLLIARETVLAHAPPDPGRFGVYAGSEWTARVFADRPGMLIPASTVRVPAPAPGSAVDALRAARASGWGKGETLRALGRSLAA